MRAPTRTRVGPQHQPHENEESGPAASHWHASPMPVLLLGARALTDGHRVRGELPPNRETVDEPDGARHEQRPES